MARGIKKVILIGRLGNDPDVRYTATGTAVTTISLATSESWRDRNTGEPQQRTEWHRVIFFGRRAETAGQYLKKGSQIYVEGSIRTNRYTDKNGIERYSKEIHVNEMQMLGGGRYPHSNPSGKHVDDLSMIDSKSHQTIKQIEEERFNNRNDFDIDDEEIPF